MPQLLLLRHAKSSWEDPSLPDHQRPLNGRGERSARLIAGAFATMRFAPDLALVSSARRAQQTFAALDLLPEAVDLRFEDGLYLADADTLGARLRTVAADHASVLLVGHNPGLYELALELVGDDPAARPEPPVSRLLDGYPTASLAVFDLPVPWAGLDRGRGRLTRFVRPEDLEDGESGASGG